MEPMLPPAPVSPSNPPPPPPFSRPAGSAPPFLPGSALPYPAQHGGPWAPVGSRRHGLAVAALVCGIAGIPFCFLLGVLPILAIVFGLISARAIRASNGALTGLGMARAGWILGLVGLASAGLFFWAGLTGRFDEDEGTATYDSAVGDCIATLPEEGVMVGFLDTIDCAKPHEGEVYMTLLLDPSGDQAYPGDDAVLVDAQERCLAGFEPYVGKEYTASDFEIYIIRPSELAWKATDGRVSCILFEPGEQITGTARGVDR